MRVEQKYANAKTPAIRLFYYRRGYCFDNTYGYKIFGVCTKLQPLRALWRSWFSYELLWLAWLVKSIHSFALATSMSSVIFMTKSPCLILSRWRKHKERLQEMGVIETVESLDLPMSRRSNLI